MPNSSEGRLYDYSDEYLVNNSLEYTTYISVVIKLI